jgi:membrane associated rhomboid family serine protease
LVWIFARSALHIGASGLLYGIALFLMTIGLFRKDARSILVSVLIVFFYSGILWGVLPIYPGVSFESHLTGALVGVGCASAFSKSRYLYE